MLGRALGLSQQILRPLLTILDTIELLLCRPQLAAQALVGPEGQGVRRSAAYFVTTFSLTVVFNRVGLYALGLESFRDIPYWVFHAGIVLVAASVGAAVVSVLRCAPSTTVFSAYFWSYGTSFLLGAAFMAGAALTIRAAQELGYIPPVAIDPSLFTDTESALSSLLFQCMRNESVVFSVLYHALYGSLEAAHKPIDSLSYLLPASYVLGIVLSTILVFYSATRNAVAAAVAVGLSAIASYSAILFAVFIYANWSEARSDCTADSVVDTAYQMSATDYVRRLASRLSQKVGNPIGPGILVSAVEADGRTVVIRADASPAYLSERDFQRWVAVFRKQRESEYCRSDWGSQYRKMGIAQVYLVRFGGLVESIVQSHDACRR